MIRDIVAGVLCGGVVSAVGLGVLSQVTPGPRVGAEAPVAVVAPADPAVPVAPAPVDPVASAPAAADTKPSTAVPETEPPEVHVADPPPAAAPASPTDATPPPAEAAPPSLPDAAVPPTSDMGATVAEDAAPAPVAQAPANAPDSAAPSSPATPASPSALPAPTAEPPAPAAGQSADPLLEPEAEPAPAAAPADVAPLPDVVEGDEPKVLEPDVTMPLAPAAELPKAEGLPKAADGVTVGRLPSIAAPEAGAEAAPAEAMALPDDASQPPIKRYAAAFANTSGKPLFSLILSDDGSPDLDRAKLAALPFPVTFAVNPLAPNAAEAAATYRAGGKEVVMIATGLPTGAQPSDVEQSFQAMSAALPESVAVVDLAQKGFQDDRALASQIVAIIKDQGRGLITYDRGLNAADQVARREDLPAAIVFRDLDGQGEETPMIRRYLDRAAFKAAQEGRVTVIGTAKPATVAAIMEWTIEGRASSVTMAPASAVMVAQ